MQRLDPTAHFIAAFSNGRILFDEYRGDGTTPLCRLIQYRKEGGIAPLFPVLNQPAHCYIVKFYKFPIDSSLHIYMVIKCKNLLKFLWMGLSTITAPLCRAGTDYYSRNHEASIPNRRIRPEPAA